MTDLESGRKAFAEWPEERRTELLDELVSLICSTELHAVGAGVVREAYRRVVVESGVLDKIALTKEWWTEPYALIFQQCVADAAMAAKDLPASESISFIFAKQERFAARATDIFAQLRADRDWKRRERLGELSFADTSERAGLQAADLLVWELRKRLDHKLKQPSLAVRGSLNRLGTKLVLKPRYFDEERLSEFFADILAARPRSGGTLFCSG
jgi:hypothetical protein